ncbi:MAG TPA: 2OG-Fe(II) oxygenase [Myxococcota bacterium]|nr:2OG-Fe(II) oxygenase [Myxococcota bacterium]
MALINGDESPLAIFPSAVTAEACDHLLAEAAALQLEPGRVVPYGEPVGRHVHLTFLPRDHWSAAIVASAADQANTDMAWGYALSHLESLQFGAYRSGDGHDWHMDTLSHGDHVRKLTVMVQLDEGDAYDGGDLELLRFGVARPEPLDLPREALRARGTTLVFPSYLLHRVSPVTRGERRTLVAWFVGPRFR